MTQREALNAIHAALMRGEIFGTVHRFRDDHPDGPRPYFSPALYKIPFKPFIGWTHYGSSASKATKTALEWTIRQIFDTTPAEFLDRYTTRSAFAAAGEIWIGAAAEYCVIDIEDDGSEGETVYGYIVADCQAWRDEDIKRIVCEWADIDPEETRLEMIESTITRTEYKYRIA